MADPARTHKATPKRVREFRARGEIALSRDVVSTATLTGGFCALAGAAGVAATALLDLSRRAASAADGTPPGELASSAAHTFMLAAGPALIGAAAGAVIASAAQLGWPPALRPLSFDLGRISPLQNLGNAFGPAGMARRAGAALAKLTLVAAIVVFALRKQIISEPVDAASLGALGFGLVRRAMWLVLGVLGALAAIDYLLARRRLGDQMKMTAEEVKRDARESEGDPAVRGRRRQRMRELARRRVATAVAGADVVVVNPTHYAVALRYDEQRDAAPTVVAKGVDEEAERIREIARKHGVPILSRPPLARALWKLVKEGRPVPANLYRAVAEVLAYVYRVRRGSA